MSASVVIRSLARTARPGLDERALMTAVLNGDDAAFAELVRRYGPMVLSVCRRVLGSGADVDDAFQLTFLALVEHARSLRAPAALPGWLHRTAFRAAVKLKARRPPVVVATEPVVDPEPLTDLSWNEVLAMLDEELNALPERLRAPLVLCFLSGRTRDDAAAALGVSLSTLKRRVADGLDRLNRRLVRRGVVGAGLVAAALGGDAGWGLSAAVPAALAQRGAAVFGARRMGAVVTFPFVSWKSVIPVVVLMGGLVAAGASLIGSETLTVAPPLKEGNAEPPAQVRTRADAFGDPLPAGALMRLGTLRGAATVTSFGIVADGAVLTVGEEGDLRLWQPESDTPEPAVRLPVRVSDEWYGRFRSYISSDAKRVACCAPESVIVYERRGENVPAEIGKFKFPRVESGAFASDGKKLVVVTTESKKDEYAVHVCDVQTGQSRALVTDLRHIREVRFSADSRRVAVNTVHELLVFDFGTGKQLARWSVDGLKLSHVALNTTGDVVAARVYKVATEEYLDVRFFEAVTGKAQKGATGTDGGDWVTFAPDGKTVLIGDARGVRWWDPIAGRLLRQFDGATGELSYGATPVARFTPDGKVLVATTGRVLFRWDAATGKPLFPEVHAGSHFGKVRALGVSADGTRYATSAGSRIRVWDAATGKPVATVPSDNQWPHNLEFSRNGKTLFAPVGGEIVQWDAATGTELRRFAVDPKEPRQMMVIGLRLSDDDTTLTGVTLGRVKGTRTSVFTTWDAQSGRRQFTKKLDPFDWNARRYCINFSPNALYASLHGDVFLTADGPTKGLLPPRTLGPGFDAGAFSADGGRIAFTYIDESGPRRVMRGVVYGVATGAKLCDLPAGSSGRVALNSDGSVLAAAGLTDLTFWDTSTGKLLARHRSPPAEKGDTIYSFAEVMRFTADGTKLITGHADTTALVWSVPKVPK
ncbi:sigma-70 family RNA polymerase sigma factor [Gemmata sp. JC673]|uniref:Sigma-70 family RNA polymerase sigma factor n=1 Tax=Gemmata algarum TaxID=2975278 RepID=A0ABU5EV95_9BACT|nr:sigma-70 family RNA polymerase sigma factor [Gemmata algarum]MDY3559105.1 sigma-70 family RNA polymerase sigma factor [Gemmata algarum]